MANVFTVQAPQPFFVIFKILGAVGGTNVVGQDDQTVQITCTAQPDIKATGLEATAKLIGPNISAGSDADGQAKVTKWLSTAESIMPSAYKWLASTQGMEASELESAKQQIEQVITDVSTELKTNKHLAGSTQTIADLSMCGVLFPIMQKLVSATARAEHNELCTWMEGIVQQDGVGKAIGDTTLNPVEQGWLPIDAAKEAKKRAKAVDKEAKLAKLLAKQGKQAALKSAAAAGGESSKKAKAKEEAAAKQAAADSERQSAINAARATPVGKKKDTSAPLPSGYYPLAVESAWYSWWEKEKFFEADANSDKPPYVLVIPPPNVTGVLHIGHALTDAIEDVLVRWKRMSGFEVCWVPGTDHAGIATQTVVEKMLAKQGISRHQLGREAFLDKVHEWVDTHGSTIKDQLRKMGCSLDWSKYAYTMDDARAKSVQEAFVRMHSEGYVYRANRLVNWCCKLNTSVSDIEVDYIDVQGHTQLAVPGYDKPVEFGVLTSFAYQIEGGDGEVVVATTRPETMLGDTAVAVHPQDQRYLHLHGKRVKHPFLSRTLPIITDAQLVDMEFGTGCVKITPAHDPNDYIVGQRHNLGFISIFDDDGTVNEEGGEFKGMKRFEVRTALVDKLKSLDLFRGVAPNPMRLGLCSRSKDVIEPMLRPQWWVKCGGLAEKGLNAVKEGELKIVPIMYTDTWYDWLGNIRDWCISRQLWWGHRVPAWYVVLEGESAAESGTPGFGSENSDRWVVGRNEQQANEQAKKQWPGKSFTLTQDNDVLDTWFSSGLFPFSTMGWPNDTKDMDKFYPNTILETGWDILFFWVARMVMMGYALCGKLPFHTVFLHPMVRDKNGEKMSKSKGNVIDPIHVINGVTLQELNDTLKKGNLDPKECEKGIAAQQENYPDGIEQCGADALRFALVNQTTHTRDLNLDVRRVVGYRRFCNKIWNAVKFGLNYLPPGYTPDYSILDKAELALPQRYMLDRLATTCAQVNANLEQYSFAEATSCVYSFWWDHFCDVYIEMSKPVLQAGMEDKGGNEEDVAIARAVLCKCLEAGLRLLHPFMPFVTEELWQRVPKQQGHDIGSICIASFPQEDEGKVDEQARSDMKTLLNVIDAARRLRSAYGLLNKHKPPCILQCTNATKSALLSSQKSYIATLAQCSDVQVVGGGEGGGAGCGVELADQHVNVLMVLTGQVDAVKEAGKLKGKLEEAEGKAQALQTKLGASAYAKTPNHIKEKDQEKLVELSTSIASLQDSIKRMEQLSVEQS